MMSPLRRLRRLAFGLPVPVAIVCLQLTLNRAAGVFTPFVPQTLPQHAWGDFDEDGRPDVALIQDGAGGSHVSVRLSGSPGAVVLDAKVVSLITADVDHDGDLDLVGAAPSGEVLTWINDGRGRFTLLETLPSPRNMSPATAVVGSARNEFAALGTTAPVVVGPDRRNKTAVVVSSLRRPAAPRAFDLSLLLLPSLRAPPPFIVLI